MPALGHQIDEGEPVSTITEEEVRERTQAVIDTGGVDAGEVEFRSAL